MNLHGVWRNFRFLATLFICFVCLIDNSLHQSAEFMCYYCANSLDGLDYRLKWEIINQDLIFYPLDALAESCNRTDSTKHWRLQYCKSPCIYYTVSTATSPDRSTFAIRGCGEYLQIPERQQHQQSNSKPPVHFTDAFGSSCMSIASMRSVATIVLCSCANSLCNAPSAEHTEPTKMVTISVRSLESSASGRVQKSGRLRKPDATTEQIIILNVINSSDYWTTDVHAANHNWTLGRDNSNVTKRKTLISSNNKGASASWTLLAVVGVVLLVLSSVFLLLLKHSKD